MLTITCTAISLLWGVACDKAVETVEEDKSGAATAQAEASMAIGSRLDLEAVITRVSSGEVTSAAELEAELEADAVANVDIDVDGKKDELRIVERRVEKTAVFEIRAVPSSKVDIDIEAAPVIAQVEFEAKADAGTAIARASYSATFAATAKLDASATFEHTFTGVAVTAEGRMHVEADANVFVAWAFRPSRPMYVAEVFVIHQVEPPAPDPCWPPGHCKHGLWKATGELPPGHERDRDDVTFARGHKELGKTGPMDDHKAKPDHDHGKAKADATPSASKADKGASHGGDKGDKGHKSDGGGSSKGGKGGKGK